jgi:hypothetical protein
VMDRTHDGRRSACCASSMSSRVNAWRSGPSTSSTPGSFSKRLPICFSFTGRRNTSVLTITLNLWRRRCADGSNGSASRRSTSNLAVHGKTAIARASTRNFAMEASRPRDLLHDEGGENPDRMVAASLQHPASALVSGLSPAGAKNNLANGAYAALRSGPGGMSATRNPPSLTFDSDHFDGAGQTFMPRSIY